MGCLRDLIKKHDIIQLKDHYKGTDMERNEALFVVHRGPSQNKFSGPSLHPLDEDNVLDEMRPPDGRAVCELRP